MKNWKIIVLLAVVGIAVLAAVLVFNSKPAEKPAENDTKRVAVKSPKVPRNKPRKRSELIGKSVDNIDKHKIDKHKDAAQVRVKPRFVLDDDDESKLNEEQRRTIEAIRAALEDNSKKTVLKLVQKLQASDEWPDGIPKSIKMAAIEALGWFGSSCLPELAGFLADGDEAVVQAAVEKYEEMLSDADLSARERSEILIQASKVINDADAMDSMLFELINMPRSIAVETMKELIAGGNAATQEVLPDNIEFITGEENITTPQQLDEWYKQNPDDEGDDEFYENGKPSPNKATASGK